MKNALLLLSILTLVGCAADPNKHNLIVLQNPATKETKECRGNGWTSWNPSAEVEACAKAYEKAGYKRIGAY